MQKTRFLVILVIVAGCIRGTAMPVLRIATDATFAPFHYIESGGYVTGYDVELARAVALNAGFTPEIVVLPYDELFSGLQKGLHDMVAATTGITDERRKTYRFSQPYFETCQVAVVRLGDLEPQTTRELVGLRIGASGQGTSKQAMELVEGTHISTADGRSTEMLLNGSIDAWIVDEFDAVMAAQSSKGKLRVLAEEIMSEQYGFVLAGNNFALQEKLDLSLEKLIDDGSVDDLLLAHGVQRGTDWPVVCTAGAKTTRLTDNPVPAN